MTTLNISEFQFYLTQIKDGFLFEKFAQAFLTAILGYDFSPVGGTKDKGIDGLEKLFAKRTNEKTIFQISIEKNYESKIERSLKTLVENKIEFDLFTYVTNVDIRNKDQIIDHLTETYKKPIRLFDLNWFSVNVVTSTAAILSYHNLVKANVHAFSEPNKNYIISNLEGDPHLYVFLRQQLEERGTMTSIDDLLADSLILYALEDTNPEVGKLKTKDEIKRFIKTLVKFDLQVIEDSISRRLLVLSRKPRKIKYHSKQRAYCLPYETRLEIQERNLHDKYLLDRFFSETELKIKKYLDENEASVKDLAELINVVVHKIYYMQGLEFSNFILHGKSEEILEKDLSQVLSSAIDESKITIKNRVGVKNALLMAVRDIVYNGSLEQKEYLKSLSNTYLMMFTLHWNPRIATYFESMANQLRIFVCTSILIPAISEFFLAPENRRHWNLLTAAKNAGIQLYVNNIIVNELASHFNMIKNKYDVVYKKFEDIYLSDEQQMIYIDEIIIRAYFYAKMRNKVTSFEKFLDNFVDPDLENINDDLIIFLKQEFNIEYKTNDQFGIKLNNDEVEGLADKLKNQKSVLVKAQSDAKIILTIYKLREKNNEKSNSNIFGYQTWWLSKDVTTYKELSKLKGNKYSVSCYMRPEFLYNYIVLTPRKYEVDSAYKKLFPTLLGVSISSHLPKEVTDYVQEKIAEHGTKQPARVIQTIRKLTNKLKSDPSLVNKAFVVDFLETEVDKLINEE